MMKKTFSLIVAVLMVLMMVSVAGAEDGSSTVLIAYFTNPEPDGIDAVSRASRVVVEGEVLGNAQFIAQVIQDTTNGDMFAIETVQDYPARPDLMDMAAAEGQQNARPELKAVPVNLEDYDVIFLGYPNWNADLPMPMYTFLEAVDLSGKTIIPFCPHGGSGFSNTVNTISELQPEANVRTDGFTISRDSVPESTEQIVSWVESLGL